MSPSVSPKRRFTTELRLAFGKSSVGAVCALTIEDETAAMDAMSAIAMRVCFMLRAF
jgi:hypothetical protein